MIPKYRKNACILISDAIHYTVLHTYMYFCEALLSSSSNSFGVSLSVENVILLILLLMQWCMKRPQKPSAELSKVVAIQMNALPKSRGKSIPNFDISAHFYLYVSQRNMKSLMLFFNLGLKVLHW